MGKMPAANEPISGDIQFIGLDSATYNGYYKSDGEFGWKILELNRFAVLYIPKGTMCHVEYTAWSSEPLAHRLRAPAAKRRAAKAYVVAIGSVQCEELTRGEETYYQYKCVPEQFGLSLQDPTFSYHKGKLIKPKMPFGSDTSSDVACAHGIHYFAEPVKGIGNATLGRTAFWSICQFYKYCTREQVCAELETKIAQLRMEESE